MQSSETEKTIVHLIYIHGFQGDHTSFQSFPMNLHDYLSPLLPAAFELRSTIYPTYKSKRPLSEASRKFLEWLKTQPPGLVILAAHSMGGLLAAEAATWCKLPSIRIIGLLAFDVPFLGLHPHVIISGIASLVPKGNCGKQKSEKEMNKGSDVNVMEPDNRLEAEWEKYKATFKVPKPRTPPVNPITRAISPFSSAFKSMKKIPKHPLTHVTRWVVEYFEFGIAMFDPSGLKDRYTALEHWNGRWVNFWTETEPRSARQPTMHTEPNYPDPSVEDLSVAPGMLENTANMGDALDSDSDSPVGSSSGSNGNGDSSNGSSYGFSTFSKTPRRVLSSSDVAALQKAETKIKEQRRMERIGMKPRPSRHFIILPHGSKAIKDATLHKWEKVGIAAEDEVDAHTGIFMMQKNRNYDAFVKRVAVVVLHWCDDISRESPPVLSS